ncbi:MAG: CoA-binding protein [Lentisphaerae bacterium]|nr:CoA-binding protein [Lentisphaerota bacterium]
MNQHSQRVVVLGASANPERYSHRAIKQLLQHGHTVIPVNPAGGTIEGLTVAPNLEAVSDAVDTLTLYVAPVISSTLADAIVALHPRRVIFNPGTENPQLRARLDANRIPTQEACTLVLLGTGQF